ncbi:MAG: hypothetical protein IPN91_05585 [Holophagaceae bacterium]|jgi:hypothetical protein|uniref:Uncharacterized protein n=1 Tax=Candidatus Geothrix odensensis TaxID=2954440 RepID=A0A936F0X3_9BACT|nr:hypothetical protein [Candidatus Geothrix odensensis]
MPAQAFFPAHPPAMPAHVSLVCPQCTHLASFEPPYWAVLQGEPPPGSGALIEWKGRLVQARFPGQVPWDDPCNAACRPAARSKTLGVVVCAACGLVRRHLLDWPGDAFFKCDIQGRTLWAWNRSHLQAIQVALRGERGSREPSAFGPVKVPRHFLIAKHRDLVLEATARLLESIRA